MASIRLNGFAGDVMFESLKETWNKIQEDPPGKRFLRQFRRRQAARSSIIKRILFVGTGLGIGTLGLIMIFTPGPGLFFIFIGLGLIAQESLWLAMLLDRIEVKSRKWARWLTEKWRKLGRVLQVLVIGLIVLFGALLLYWGYAIFLV